ncbi:hypothetical protein [Symbiobacterium thermophilum]|nr:hypothetical protein [Symbiobacterium thermophilum]
MIRRVAAVIIAETGIPKVRPGRHEIWLTFVRRTGTSEERVMPGRRDVRSVMTGQELAHAVAESIVLTVFGGEIQVVDQLPNVKLRLLDRRADLHLPGAPPLDQDGQVWLRVTVRRSEPGLLERLFGPRVHTG